MKNVEAVLHEGVWSVAYRTSGVATDLCTAQQARDRALAAEGRGDTELAKQLRDAADYVEQRNAQLGPK
jgi:hypothetical protein